MSATWPRRWRCCGPSRSSEPPEVDDATISISEAVERLRSASRMDAPRALADMLDHLDASGRFALLKLATGRASRRDQRAARQAGAGRRLRARGRSGRGGLARPEAAVRRAVRLGRGARRAAARPRRARLPPVHARPSAGGRQGLARRLCGRVEMGRDPRPAGPRRRRDAALQPHRRRYFGQLSRCRRGVSQPRACSTASCWCAGRTRAAPTFTAARRRASTRSSNGSAARTSARRCSASYPAFVRLYDILFDGEEDLRELPWHRAARAARSVSRRRLDPERFDVSQLIEAASFEQLEDLRSSARDVAIEGIMLKRRDSPYVAGRRAGLWYKWKRDPLTADCVLMYAQRGSGKRSSYYSDYTFGCWTGRRASCCRSARPISASPTRS